MHVVERTRKKDFDTDLSYSLTQLSAQRQNV